ncbi:hypothetical protein C882_0280 [Caenispirillum salinarum AK4]|uniref:Translocation and assembly module TamB C-terminal domain-containing protein n=1 Tax=Caenispirillum salinarum AK4 TaxID=1238182 RepID=K9GYK3_9PROT|nr:translocation/assembly module TamB domain-containing protein [Caenispirillum salinarum]EKV29849.1 hypothetical protein C882_0280 [Caenispirillum salinarum AK4]
MTPIPAVSAARRAATVLLLALMLSIGSGAGQDAGAQIFGTDWFKGKVENLLSGGGLEVEIGGLEGPLPGAVTLRDVTVSDPQGVFLRLPRATLDWSPLALVRGRFTIDELSSEGGELLRLPDLPPGEEPPPAEGTGDGFDLGVLERLRVDVLNLQRFRLAEPVLGEDMVLTAEGSLGPVEDGDGIRTDLVVERVDERGGRAAVSATISPGQELALDVQIAEPAGGIIARLADLPGLPPVQVALEGAGPAARWSGELSAVAEDLAQVEGDITLGLPAGGEWSAGADLAVSVTQNAPPTWQALVRESLALAVDARGTAEGTVTVSTLRAANDAFSLTGQNVALGPQGALDGTVTLSTDDADALTALVDLPFEAGTVTADLDGSLQAPQALVDATLRQVETGTGAIDTVEGRLQLRADGPPTAPDTPLTVSGGVTLLGLPEPAPDPRAEIAIDATLVPAENRLAVRLLQVESESFQADAQLTADVAELTAEGVVNVRSDNLETFGALAGLDVEGQGRIEVVLDRAAATGAVDGSARIALSDLQWGEATYAALLGDHLTVMADLSRTDEGAVRVGNLTIDSGGINGGGEAALPADMETIQAAFVLQVPELSAVAPDVAGGISVDGTVSGPLTAPDLDVVATSPALTASGQRLTDIRLQATAQGLDAAGAQGRLALTATGPDGAPVRINTTYTAPEWQRIILRDLGLRAAGLALDGGLTVALPPALGIEGTLSGGIANWSALSGLAGMEIDGSGSGLTLTFNDTGQGQRVAAQLSADRLALPAEDVRVRDLLLEARLGNLFTAPSVTADLTTDAGAAAGLSWNRAAVGLDGDLQAGTITASLQGPTELETQGRYNLQDDRLVLEGFRVQDDATGLGARLTQPATISFGGGDLGVSDLRLALDGRGMVAVDAALGPQRVALDLRVDGVPLETAEPFLGDGMVPTGVVDARIDIAGPPSNPTGTVTARIPDLAIPEAEIRGLSLDVTGDLRNERLELRAQLGGVRAEEAVATASIPVAFSPQGIPSLPETQPIEALVNWRGRLENIWPLVPVVGHRLYGEGFVRAGVTGTIEEPELAAEARITNGRYENLEYGTVLTNLRLEADRRPDGTVALTLTGDDAGRGTLRLDARADLTDEGGLVIDADGGFQRATLVRRDDLRATVSGDLGFQGPLDGGTFTADLTVNEGLLRLINTLGGGVTTLDVVEEGGEQAGLPVETDPEALQAAEAPVVIGLDISVTIPNQFYVRGRGLESEWSGALRITGTTNAPQMVGQIQVVRGQFDLVGNTFTFTEGEVDLTGGQRINPRLNIEAANETAGDVTAIIAVSGTARDPEIQLTSIPPLPEDEVMARVLFGAGLEDLGPVEALQAANAVRVLSGLGGGGPGITEVIASTIGVDTIRLAGGEDGPALEIGKYITEDVYVGVEQGVGAESTGVNVEVQLTPSISVEGRTSTRGSDVGVNWSRDY